MIKAFSSSLSLRLLGIFIVTAVLIIAILIGLFSRGLSGQWKRSIEPHLVQYAHYIQQELGSPPQPERAADLARRLSINIDIYKGRQLFYSTSPTPLNLRSFEFKAMSNPPRKRPTQSSTGRGKANTLTIAISESNKSRQRLLRIKDGDFTIYYNLFQHRQRRLPGGRFTDELLLALAALGLVLIGSYLTIRHQLSPINQIQKSVGRMAEGQLDHRIGRRGHGDLDELAKSIDSMAQQIQAMLDAKRQLLMAISHELRSPVTRARITTELLPDSRNRDRLLDDLADMERMITDIMESEQLQGNHTILNRSELQPYSLFKEELHLLAPECSLQSDSHSMSVSFNGDAARLRIMLRNLVVNALQHGKNTNGQVELEVSFFATAEALQLIVSDSGPGIAAEHINEIGDAFYRPDPSRSRSTGGFGLGLSLARLIAEAHNGSLTVDSDPTTKPGTRIVVKLPIG